MERLLKQGPIVVFGLAGQSAKWQSADEGNSIKAAIAAAATATATAAFVMRSCLLSALWHAANIIRFASKPHAHDSNMKIIVKCWKMCLKTGKANEPG